MAAKKVKTIIKLNIKAGEARLPSPASPLAEQCEAARAAQAFRKEGEINNG